MKIEPVNGVIFVEQIVPDSEVMEITAEEELKQRDLLANFKVGQSSTAPALAQGIITHVDADRGSGDKHCYQPGVKILYYKDAGPEVELNGKRYTVLDEKGVLAVLSEEEPEKNKGFKIIQAPMEHNFNTTIYECLDCGEGVERGRHNQFNKLSCHKCGNNGGVQ